MAEYDDTLASHGLGELDCIMTETADANDSYSLSGTCTMTLEWGVNSEASAEHRCGLL
jgi:hypothetical protein